MVGSFNILLKKHIVLGSFFAVRNRHVKAKLAIAAIFFIKPVE